MTQLARAVAILALAIATGLVSLAAPAGAAEDRRKGRHGVRRAPGKAKRVPGKAKRVSGKPKRVPKAPAAPARVPAPAVVAGPPTVAPAPPAAAPAPTPPAPAPPGGPPVASTDQRVAYLTTLLAALRASDAGSLADTVRYVQVVERNKCQAPEPSLRVSCMLEAVARSCHQREGEERDRCVEVSDVVVTNLLSEPTFVPRALRFQLMERHKDFRAAISRELYRRYAVLVTEFALSKQFPGSGAADAALARGIEGFCREIAGTDGLSWQYCVAAVVWFIGTEGRAARPEEAR